MLIQDHSEYSFICCILSHGGTNNEVGEYIYGSDNQRVIINVIAKSLDSTSCPSLAGKPKIFFVQACRVESAEIQVPASDALTKTHRKNDIFFAYATPSDYVAWRDTDNGSNYITELCRALVSYATYSSLTEMFVSASQKLEEESIVQKIMIVNLLKSKVYFLPPL